MVQHNLQRVPRFCLVYVLLSNDHDFIFVQSRAPFAEQRLVINIIIISIIIVPVVHSNNLNSNSIETSSLTFGVVVVVIIVVVVRSAAF